MYFLVVVLVPASVHNISKAVDRLMEPYQYSFGGPPWRVHESAESIKALAARYRTVPSNLKKIAKKLKEEHSNRDFHVDDGGIYYEAPHNPNGRCEYYQLNRGPEGDTWPVATMPRDLVPAAVITPDGEWHDCWPMAKANWMSISELRYSERQDVQQCAYELIDHYPDHLAVALTCWD